MSLWLLKWSISQPYALSLPWLTLCFAIYLLFHCLIFSYFLLLLLDFTFLLHTETEATKPTNKCIRSVFSPRQLFSKWAAALDSVDRFSLFHLPLPSLVPIPSCLGSFPDRGWSFHSSLSSHYNLHTPWTLYSCSFLNTSLPSIPFCLCLCDWTWSLSTSSFFHPWVYSGSSFMA